LTRSPDPSRLRNPTYGQNRIFSWPAVWQHVGVRFWMSLVRAEMTQQEHEAAVAAFIRAKGITRCPTAFAVSAHGSVSEADRSALRQRDDQRAALRQERRLRQAALYRFGRAA